MKTEKEIIVILEKYDATMKYVDEKHERIKQQTISELKTLITSNSGELHQIKKRVF